MTVLATYTKQPIERLDYDFEYSDFLNGDSIDVSLGAVFTVEPVEPGGLVIDSYVVQPTYTKVWVSHGLVDSKYKISCTVTTLHGRVKQDEIKIRVKEF